MGRSSDVQRGDWCFAMGHPGGRREDRPAVLRFGRALSVSDQTIVSDNAIVLGETGVLNSSLRFEDEFVRHKILDAIGDLALIGYPLIGHLVAHRGGHALHAAFAEKIIKETDAWHLVDSVVQPESSSSPQIVPVKDLA